MRITIIGSGNVATHLAAALKNSGHRIVQVYSRNLQHAALLAYHVKAEAIDSLKNIDIETDVFLISVKDGVISNIAEQLAGYQKLLLHTSGATSLAVLLKYTKHAGVFYPLQTFSKAKELDFLAVPLCIEGASPQIAAQVTQLAQTVSNNVYQIDSNQRRTLHLAAVFACNFPNYLYTIAQRLLEKDGMDFNLIRPLIIETADKAVQQLPANVQTGPAVRNDTATMQKHLKMLQTEQDLQLIYEMLSQGIIKMEKGLTGDN